MSIPPVSDEIHSLPYHSDMETPHLSIWQHWSRRLGQHVREHGLKWADIAEKMDQSEGGLRHWRNGTREINLADFFRLCEAANADAYLILFGKPQLTPEQSQQLGEAVSSVIFRDVSLNPNYKQFSKGLRRGPKSGAPKTKAKASR